MIDLLFVEDELKLAQVVVANLEFQGFRIRHFANGSQAWSSFLHVKPDVVILDVMMPEMDGFTLASKIRSHDGATPMIFLTARTSTQDVVKGFKLGGNDYMRKPFDIEELVARILSLVKSSPKDNLSPNLNIGNYVLNPNRHLLHFGSEMIQLSFRQSELLKMLYENRNTILNRQDILNGWSGDYVSSGRSLDVFVSRLRKFLEKDPHIKIINIRGKGYKLLI